MDTFPLRARSFYLSFFLATSIAGCGDSTDPPGSTSSTTGGGGGMAAACAVAPLAAIAHGPAAERPLELHFVDVTKHPNAVCNDGSPAAYVVQKGSGAGEKRWLLHLHGGGECHDLASCEERWSADDKPGGRKFMGSSGYSQATLDAQGFRGILSADPTENPHFHDAAHVEMFYCSSDVWSGDKAATPGAAGVDRWHFRGRAILEAVIAELLPAGLSSATEVLLAGGSAGGYGVYNAADDVGAMLPASARFVAMPDAGFFLDYPAWDPVTKAASTASPSLVESIVAAAVVTWGGRGDASCGPSDSVACRSPEHMAQGGLIQTPLFIRQSQLDNNQLVRLGTQVDAATGVAATPEEQAYADAFGARMRERLAAADARHAVYAPLDGYHVCLTVAANKPNGFANSTIGATSLQELIEAWYLDPCKGPRLVEQPAP